MKVLITKDWRGVQVWHPDVEVEYGESLQKGKSVWMNKKIHLFRRLHVFPNKFVAKYLPNLGKDMNDGDKKFMELTFV